MTQLNKIQQKLATLNVSSTVFVHPLAEAQGEICKHLSTTAVHSFEILGVKYLIGEMNKGYPISGGSSLYPVAVREGNSLLICNVYLCYWEWLYLVKGFEAVNQIGFFEDKHRHSETTTYLSDEEFKNEIKRWEEIAAKEPEKANMPEYIKSCYSAVTMDSDGNWVKS